MNKLLLSVIVAFLFQTDSITNQIALPKGFQISVFAKNVKGARSLALASNGYIFVGTRAHGNVYVLQDSDNDGRVDLKKTLFKNLNMPNGVAFHEGDLYIAEVNRILVVNDIIDKLQTGEAIDYQVPFQGLPEDRHHGWKYIAFGPDSKLYIPVGAPCNICKSSKQIYASINRLDISQNTIEPFAHGVRNSVGFDWHPQTGSLWFTDNGRDYMGDDLPPDEVNIANMPNLHFGYPYIHGSNIPDPEFFQQRATGQSYVAPIFNNDAHVANLGLMFYRGNAFPKKYRNAAFIAEHGSWNRSKKAGYQVRVLFTEGDTVTGSEIFAKGWLRGERVSGRPVALLELPDGSVLLSDDYSDRIYRITYN